MVCGVAVVLAVTLAEAAPAAVEAARSGELVVAAPVANKESRTIPSAPNATNQDCETDIVEEAARFTKEARQQLAAAKAALEKARVEINATKAQQQKLQRAFGKAKEKASQSEAAVEADSVKASMLRESIASLEASLESEMRSCAGMEAQLRTRQEKNAERQQRVQTLEADVDRQEAELKGVQNSIWGSMDLTGSVSNGEQQVKERQAELTKTENDAKLEKERLRADSAELSGKHGRVEEGKSLVAAARAELEQVTGRLASERCALKKELADVEALRVELAQQTEATKEAVASLAAAEKKRSSVVDGVLHKQDGMIGQLREAATYRAKEAEKHSARATHAESENNKKDAKIGALGKDLRESAKRLHEAANHAKKVEEDNEQKAAVIEKSGRALADQAMHLEKTQDQLKKAESEAAMQRMRANKHEVTIDGLEKDIDCKNRQLVEQEACLKERARMIQSQQMEIGRKDVELEDREKQLAAQTNYPVRRDTYSVDVVWDAHKRAAEQDEALRAAGRLQAESDRKLCEKEKELAEKDAHLRGAHREMYEKDKKLCEQNKSMDRLMDALRATQEELSRCQYRPVYARPTPAPCQKDVLRAKLDRFADSLPNRRY